MKTILVDAVFCFVVENQGGFEIFQPMEDLLDTYLNKKIILTGANDEQFKKFGLDKMPYEVFTLKHNPEKANPEYYKTLLETHSLAAGDVIYFEHDIKAVESAKSVGITSYFYDNDKKDLVALKNFLDNNL